MNEEHHWLTPIYKVIMWNRPRNRAGLVIFEDEDVVQKVLTIETGAGMLSTVDNTLLVPKDHT